MACFFFLVFASLAPAAIAAGDIREEKPLERLHLLHLTRLLDTARTDPPLSPFQQDELVILTRRMRLHGCAYAGDADLAALKDLIGLMGQGLDRVSGVASGQVASRLDLFSSYLGYLGDMTEAIIAGVAKIRAADGARFRAQVGEQPTYAVLAWKIDQVRETEVARGANAEDWSAEHAARLKLEFIEKRAAAEAARLHLASPDRLISGDFTFVLSGHRQVGEYYFRNLGEWIGNHTAPGAVKPRSSEQLWIVSGTLGVYGTSPKRYELDPKSARLVDTDGKEWPLLDQFYRFGTGPSHRPLGGFDLETQGATTQWTTIKPGTVRPVTYVFVTKAGLQPSGMRLILKSVPSSPATKELEIPLAAPAAPSPAPAR